MNERVWEHLKLVYWSALLFLLVEYLPLKMAVANFFLAKTVGVYLMVMFIPVVFYSYTAFTGESILSVDLGSFVVAVVIGPLASFKLLTHRALSEKFAWISLAALVALGIAFAVFTFAPPHVGVFRENCDGWIRNHLIVTWFSDDMRPIYPLLVMQDGLSA